MDNDQQIGSPPDVLTLVEAAKVLRVCKETMAKLAKARKVPAKKVGGQWRFSRAALMRWLEGGPVTPRK